VEKPIRCRKCAQFSPLCCFVKKILNFVAGNSLFAAFKFILQKGDPLDEGKVCATRKIQFDANLFLFLPQPPVEIFPQQKGAAISRRFCHPACQTDLDLN
jgi:hypothetical protein